MLRMYKDGKIVTNLYDTEKPLALAMLREGKADRYETVIGFPAKPRKVPEYALTSPPLKKALEKEIAAAPPIKEPEPPPPPRPCETTPEEPEKKPGFFTRLFHRRKHGG
jgi:hypothetical protein